MPPAAQPPAGWQTPLPSRLEAYCAPTGGGCCPCPAHCRALRIYGRLAGAIPASTPGRSALACACCPQRPALSLYLWLTAPFGVPHAHVLCYGLWKVVHQARRTGTRTSPRPGRHQPPRAARLVDPHPPSWLRSHPAWAAATVANACGRPRHSAGPLAAPPPRAAWRRGGDLHGGARKPESGSGSGGSAPEHPR